MTATARNGDEWTDERQDGFWIYRDSQGRLYESSEIPAYRIIIDNATQTTVNDKLTICPREAA